LLAGGGDNTAGLLAGGGDDTAGLLAAGGVASRSDAAGAVGLGASEGDVENQAHPAKPRATIVTGYRVMAVNLSPRHPTRLPH
jgi:hypothetical protein